ncbi:MAG: hypothetical protein ACK47M_11245 [Caldilinea sp.]
MAHEVQQIDAVIVGSASSRTLSVGHDVTPEAMTYVIWLLRHIEGGDLRYKLLPPT